MARSSIEQDRVGKQIVSSNSGVRLVRHGLPLALLAVVLPCGVVSVSDAALVGDLGSTCVGDCDASGAITVDELVRGVSIALGTLPLDQCPRFDCHGTGQPPAVGDQLRNPRGESSELAFVR